MASIRNANCMELRLVRVWHQPQGCIFLFSLRSWFHTRQGEIPYRLSSDSIHGFAVIRYERTAKRNLLLEYPSGVTSGLCVNNLTLLVDNVVRTNEIYDSYNNHYTSWEFRKTTLTETVFYQVIVGEDGKPKIVDETYVAPKHDVITLQPLNK